MLEAFCCNWPPNDVFKQHSILVHSQCQHLWPCHNQLWELTNSSISLLVQETCDQVSHFLHTKTAGWTLHDWGTEIKKILSNYCCGMLDIRVVVEARTSKTKTETKTWAAETKTETIKIRSRGRPRDQSRSSKPPSLVWMYSTIFDSAFLHSRWLQPLSMLDLEGPKISCSNWGSKEFPLVCQINSETLYYSFENDK